MASRTVEVKLSELEPVKAALAKIVELHQPGDEEIEVWIDDDSGLHAKHFADCHECDGHSLPIKVCRECGYEHNGEFPTFRAWPCPTIKALALLGLEV